MNAQRGAAERVVIVGAGVAGLAAAWALREGGVTSTVVSWGVGASAMTSGAADLSPWTATQQVQPSPRCRTFLERLGIFGAPGWVATSGGVLRPTAAVGARVLSFHGDEKRVGVVNWARSDFDAPALAAQLNDSARGSGRDVVFDAVDLPGVVSEAELRYPLAAFARLFDDEARLARLLEVTASLADRLDALLTGPWLGSGRTALAATGVRMGETLSPPEGAFGMRFERAAAAWCEAEGIEVRAERVSGVHVELEAVRVETESPGGKKTGALFADGVILATGGLIGRGVGVVDSVGHPREMQVELLSGADVPGGARDGWDAADDLGMWISAPHIPRRRAGSVDGRIVLAGDVRDEATEKAPGGTVLGAIESGLLAAARFL